MRPRTNRASWTMTVEPTQEPITIVEAKQQARISHSRDEASLARFIRAARESAEEHMSRGLFTQTWQLTLDEFAERIVLPRAAPLQSATVQYYDVNGTLQTLATTVYDVDTASRPGSIARAANQTWPSLQADRNAGRVIITYVIGWTTLATIPERIKQGIRMYVAYMDCDREGLEAAGAQARAAAYACWDDRVEWIEPVPYCLGFESSTAPRWWS